MSDANTIAVALLGARMHYAVPKILHQAGMLGHFYTDICATKGWPKLLQYIPSNLRSPGMKRLSGRVPKGIPTEMITAFTSFGREYAKRRIYAKSSSETAGVYMWAGQSFCDLIIKSGLGDVGGVFTFNSSGLELLKHARKNGVRTVMEQTIAPYRIEQELLAEERERFSDWDPIQDTNEIHDAFADREEEEWRYADVILCGSEFVKQGIVARGWPSDRCLVVPYGVELTNFCHNRVSHDGPLRVLTVGAVGLRKGTPYIFEAARLLKGKAVFKVVGPVNVSSRALEGRPSNVEITGPVPRSEVREQFAWADIFLLPSICEGSATVTYEAFAAGLPVICTPNTGSLVTDGEDGFLVPIRESELIAARIEALIDSDIRRGFAEKALAKARLCSLEAYSDRLVGALRCP